MYEPLKTPKLVQAAATWDTVSQIAWGVFVLAICAAIVWLWLYAVQPLQ